MCWLSRRNHLYISRSHPTDCVYCSAQSFCFLEKQNFLFTSFNLKEAMRLSSTHVMKMTWKQNKQSQKAFRRQNVLDTHLLLLWLENGKKQGTKKRKQEANRPCKKSQFNQSIDSGWEPTGFRAVRRIWVGGFFYGLGGPNRGVRGLSPGKIFVLRCLNPCFFSSFSSRR